MALAKTKPVRPEYVAVGQRIKACMEARGLDQSAVARGLGIEPQSVQQWIRGQTNPRGYRIKALAALLDVEPWELLGTQENPAQGASKSEDQRGTTVRRIPRVSWVSAGQFREVATGSREEAEEWDTPSEPMSAQSFSLRVEGDSMEPEFPSGCVIFVDPQTQPLNGDYVVVALDDSHQATFKQLVLDGAQRYLKPLNPRYPIIPVDRDARVCGVVREMRKAYRR
jgi:SOS-response transcriptional repressor LexA